MPIGESPIKGVSWDPPHCVAGSLEQTWAVRTGPPVRTCPEPTGITQVNQHTSTFPANIYILWLFMRILLGLKLERTKWFFNWKGKTKWGFSQPPTTQAIFKTTLVPPQNNTKKQFYLQTKPQIQRNSLCCAFDVSRLLYCIILAWVLCCSCHCGPGFYGIHCTKKTNSCSSGTSQVIFLSWLFMFKICFFYSKV